MNYDIAIIGGGPAGYTAAERAAEGGLIILRQDIGQFQNILQIWHFTGRNTVFRHGQDHQAEEPDCQKANIRCEDAAHFK